MKINPKSEEERYYAILHELAIYKFLTLDQMLALGLGSYASAISKQTAQLIRDKYINKISKSRFHKAIYYLTRKGAKRAELKFEIRARYPKGTMEKVPEDYPHRNAIICKSSNESGPIRSKVKLQI